MAFTCSAASWFLFPLFLALAGGTAGGSKVPAVIVFGDSSVDAGNNNQISTVLKSNFKPYGRDFPGGRPTGRFSNGRIPSDFISQAFGLKPTVPAYLDPAYNISDFATGVCFASAGTGYDNATSDVLSVIPLWRQLQYYEEYQKKLRAYLGNDKANEIFGDALYLMSIGTNDFLENYYSISGRPSQLPVGQYEDFLAGIAGNFIRELYARGARKVSLGGVPPMGCLPLERTANIMTGRQCVDEYNKVAVEFNGKLMGLVGKLNGELPGMKVVLSNTYDILMRIIKKPSLYGFDVVETACCASGMFEMGYMCDRLNPFTCTDASKYVFWDSFHPTEKTSLIIANHLVKTALASYLT
ncbi:GDSL esterase/lipase At2g04570-like [Malania oleifera]|uniref:GDSL esterase/lipase At2g04570-like n=1 Tax=Malania oleifera TaxID=397392 RepID=UPI0025AE9B33|nr:GDSL esterase/lipase At2g04570-like [Malania oleifera]